MNKKIKNQRLRRKLRTRAKIKKTNALALRLSVFRSNKHLYGQIIDVKTKGKVLAFVCDKELKNKIGKKVEKAKETGRLLAEKALKKKIKNVVFDKADYAFKGRIKAFAEGARAGGLQF